MSLSRILKHTYWFGDLERTVSPIQDQSSLYDPSELLLLEFWDKIQATNQRVSW